MDTPLISIKAAGPALVRVGATEGVQVGVRDGAATIEGANRNTTLKRGDYLVLDDAESQYNTRSLPAADSFDNWSADRDQSQSRAAASLGSHQVPQNIALVAGDLDSYGAWQTDPSYGQIWVPKVAD